ncbi:putative WEB family protein At1g65010, chloroplastic [Malus sylvestris]|uniref:putative WEB family protein At1g65010, chloroplastic n=1 Tax=Malus sylvestris TaxID=3752 RepID=UPI0021ABB623|nr:putative WEB family protein At1g65010, chloroplastic [Malus sylvestris]
MEVDEMDSLFEGMVLFTPNNSGNNSLPQLEDLEKHHLPDHGGQDPALQSHQDGDAPPPPPPPPPPPESSSSEPLDENLFSDLTVQFQTLPDPEGPLTQTHDDLVQNQTPASKPTPPATTSRQNSSTSRRKKRAAGLRIGYARDSYSSSRADDPDLDDDSLPYTSTSISTTPVVPTSTPSSDSTPPPPPPVSLSVSEPEPVPVEVVVNDKEAPPELRLDQSKALIADKLSHARQLAASISAARKESIAKRRAAADHLNLASVNEANLEKQLEEACEAEDFDTAQRLSDSLAAAQSQKQVLLAALRDAEAECDAVDTKMHQVLQSQITAEEECASLLQRFATDASNDADLVLQTAEAHSSKETEEWLSSTEALHAKKMELEIESHIIDDAGIVLDSSIDTLVEDDKREKECLCKKKNVLMDELEKLLALVKQKEQEIAQNDRDIKQVEERIDLALSGFQDMQSSIQAKSSNLQAALSRINVESEALSTKKTEIDAFLTREQEREAKLRELARASTEEAEAYQQVAALRKTLMSSILKSREDNITLAKTEEELSKDVQMLQQDVSASRASLQELSSKKSSIQQDIASSKQKMIFIDKRIPELEAEKKVAATARNFKEAARLAAEAKSLNAEKEGIQNDMEKAILELEKLEQEIKETVNRLQETEGHILSKEKELATARFQRLLLISGIAKAEREAALELGNLEEANLLLAEAEAADSEANKLQPLYDLKVEEVERLPKQFISVELISNLGWKQLEELAALVQPSQG